MRGVIGYIKRNIMFIVILAVIIVVTSVLVIHQLVVASPMAQENETTSTPAQSVEPTQRDTAIVGFTGKLSNSDVIVLSWQIENGQQEIETSTLYFVDEQKGDIWIADVTNHSSYQLAQDAYQFEGGENTFKIVCTLDDDTQIESTTDVNIISLESIEFSKEETENGIYLYLKYTSNAGSVIDVPVLSYYGNNADSFSLHYLQTQRTTQEDKQLTTVSYFLQDNGVKAGKYPFTIKFQFLQLNKEYEYSVEYVKEDEPTQEEETDEQPVEETIG